MRKLVCMVVLVAASCGGSDSDATGDRTSEKKRWEKAPATTERPPIVTEGAVPYRLDYGQILWIEPSGIGRMVGPTGECDDLMGDSSSNEWHDLYADVPGFKGLVCNVPDPMNP